MDFPFVRSFVRPCTSLVTRVRVAGIRGSDNALIQAVGRAKRGIVTNAFNATLIGPPKRGDTSPPDVFSSRDLITLTFYRADSFSWSRRRIQRCSHTMENSDRARRSVSNVLRFFNFMISRNSWRSIYSTIGNAIILNLKDYLLRENISATSIL